MVDGNTQAVKNVNEQVDKSTIPYLQLVPNSTTLHLTTESGDLVREFSNARYEQARARGIRSSINNVLSIFRRSASDDRKKVIKIRTLMLPILASFVVRINDAIEKAVDRDSRHLASVRDLTEMNTILSDIESNSFEKFSDFVLFSFPRSSRSPASA